MIMPIGRQLRELDTFESRGAPILSLYITTDPGSCGREALQQKVRSLIGELGVGLSEGGRADLACELDVIRDYLNSMVAAPRALALFTCTRRRFFRVVRLPVDVQTGAWLQPHAETRPLREAADRAWGLLLESEPAAIGQP
jgi:hypothetical protein